MCGVRREERVVRRDVCGVCYVEWDVWILDLEVRKEECGETSKDWDLMIEEQWACDYQNIIEIQSKKNFLSSEGRVVSIDEWGLRNEYSWERSEEWCVWYVECGLRRKNFKKFY